MYSLWWGREEGSCNYVGPCCFQSWPLILLQVVMIFLINVLLFILSVAAPDLTFKYFFNIFKHISSPVPKVFVMKDGNCDDALWTALKWPALDLWTPETRKRCTHCTLSWEKTSKDQFSWTTWTCWHGMARTRSGCPGRTRPSPLPPTSSHTLVTCPSDSLPSLLQLVDPTCFPA